MRHPKHVTFAGFAVAVALMAAVLACNAAGGSQPDSQATIQAVYATITAQAGALPTATAQTIPTAEPTTGPTTDVTLFPDDVRTGNGTNLSISVCPQAITIDAVSADWGEVERFALSNNTYGSGAWSDAADLSGYARLCWSESALYLFVEVSDDQHVQTESGGSAWKGDEVELLFDGDLAGDFYYDTWDDDDTQLGLSPGDFGSLLPSAMHFHPSVAPAEDVRLAARQTGAGGNYWLEAEIRWRALRVTPQAERTYGLCVALSDNDSPGEAIQQSMVSHCTRLAVFNPTTWITVELSP
nr:hypothetical protein [Anaerolineae bacterium]